MRRLTLSLLTSWACALLAAPAVADTPAAQAAPPDYYVARALTDADLQGKALRELSLMRNTIFARAGNPFRKAWLDRFFRQYPWYRPGKTWDPKKISALDWQNAKTIATFESNLTTAELKRRVAAVQAKIDAKTATPADQIEMRLLSARLGKWQASAPPPSDRSPLEDPRLLDKQLTLKQLDNMSRRDLRLLRNLIYARHGYRFKSELLRGYFSDFEWYRPDPKFTSKRLTRIDWRNIKLVKSLEKTLGGPMTDHEHMEEDGWFIAA